MSLRNVIQEKGRNFPAVLGFINKPWTAVRTADIGNQAMALGIGETPVHLAQKFLGQTNITGPSQLPSRLTMLLQGQATKRPTPIRNLLEGKGLFRQQTERNIPSVYERPGHWPADVDISDLPSAVGILGGSGRTVHPQIFLASI